MGYLSGYETHIVCWRKDLLITMYILRAIVVSSHTIRVDMTREPGDARRSRSDSSESMTYELKRSSELSDATLQSRTPHCSPSTVCRPKFREKVGRAASELWFLAADVALKAHSGPCIGWKPQLAPMLP